MGLVCFASLLATVGVLLGQCTPARSLWTFSITDKTCFDKNILIGYCIYAGCEYLPDPIDLPATANAILG